MTRTRLLIAWSVLATLLSFAYRQTVVLDQDVAYMYFAAAEMLAGKRLYVDIADINPPLVYWLTLPAPLLAKALGLSGPTAFLLYFHAWLLGCLLLAERLVRPSLLLGLSLPPVIYVLPGVTFLQRDHLMFALILPWVLQRGRSNAASPIPLTLLAFLGIAIKPFFVVLPVAVLLSQAVARRTWRPLFDRDAWLLGGLYLAYLLVTRLIYPDLFTEVMPRALFAFPVLNHSYPVLLQYEAHVLQGLLVAVALVRLQPDRTDRGIHIALLGGAFGGFATYMVQHRGWEYHAVPMAGFTCLLLAQTIEALPRTLVLRSLAVVSLLVAAVPRFVPATPLHEFMSRDVNAFVAAHPTSTVAALSNEAIGFPLTLYTGSPWLSRFQWLWPIPVLRLRELAGISDGRDAALADYVRQAVVEDWQPAPPDMVLVTDEALPGFSMDYPAFFSQDPRFRALWSGYTRCRRFQSVTVYVRKPDGLCPATD